VRLAHESCMYCPYCYEEISGQQFWFRCAGRISRSGQRCLPEIDLVLRDRTGFGGALPPTFAVTGRPSEADCPACHGETTIRICPVCHSRLPVHFGKVGSRLIVPVGAKEAGKTVFMTVLVHELMHQTGQRFNAAITGADDHTRQRFASEYERPLYRESRLLPPTTAAGTDNRAPLVFRFTTERQRSSALPGRLGRAGLFGKGLPGHGDPQRTLLSFFDTAGEDLRSQQSIEQNVRYLGAADGILLILDPLQMRGARKLAAPGTLLPTPGIDDDEPAAVLERVTELLLSEHRAKPDKRIDKPLAIVFTKMDTLMNDLKQTSPLRRPPPEGQYFDERDSSAVHTEIQRLLARWEGTRIDQIAQLNYSKYRYFGVSALGETPTQDNHVSARGIRPYRIASPILWILAQFGIIPVK
jgi:Double-GTPase 2